MLSNISSLCSLTSHVTQEHCRQYWRGWLTHSHQRSQGSSLRGAFTLETCWWNQRKWVVAALKSINWAWWFASSMTALKHRQADICESRASQVNIARSYLKKLSIITIIIIVYVWCMCVGLWQHAVRPEHRLWIQFSPSTFMWIPGFNSGYQTVRHLVVIYFMTLLRRKIFFF